MFNTDEGTIWFNHDGELERIRVTATGVRTDVSALHITSIDWDHDGTNLEFLTRVIARYRDLIVVAALIAAQQGEIEAGSIYRSAPDNWPAAIDAASQFSVARMTYASPLEIVLVGSIALGSVSATAYAVTSRVMKLYDRYLDLRKKQAEVDLHRAMYNHIREELGYQRPDGTPGPKRPVISNVNVEPTETLYGAVDALEATQDIRLEPM